MSVPGLVTGGSLAGVLSAGVVGLGLAVPDHVHIPFRGIN